LDDTNKSRRIKIIVAILLFIIFVLIAAYLIFSSKQIANNKVITSVISSQSSSSTQSGDVNGLDSVEIPGYPGLNFSKDKFEYDAITIPSGQSSISFIPKGSGKILVDGIEVFSGDSSGVIALAPGEEKTITIEIITPGAPPKTYTFKIRRSAGVQATPTFSPSSGSIAFKTYVTINSDSADTIYYTTDGSDPVTTGLGNSLIYSTPVYITRAVTIKALAVKSGWDNSEIGSASYTQATTVDLSNLEISDSPSNYTFNSSTYQYSNITVGSSVSSITITPTGAGTITVDGLTVPSGHASQSITLTSASQKTITVIATESGKISKTYVLKVTRNSGVQATPTFYPTPGIIDTATNVVISSSGADAIYYTLDGSTPTTSSFNQATNPINISSNAVIKAIAVKSGLIDSNVATGTYSYNILSNPKFTSNDNLWSSKYVIPSGYVEVPGSATNGTNDFLVMKYEAKCANTSSPTVGLTSPTTSDEIYRDDGASNTANNCTSANNRQVVSLPDGYPITYLSRAEAITRCSSISLSGDTAHLITNSEWMTIARNAELQNSNWSLGTVGLGYMYAGHNDGSPNKARIASSNDTYRAAYTDSAGTTENLTTATNTANGQSGTVGSQIRTLNLSNGSVIWDLAGNAAEWTSSTLTGDNQPTGGANPDQNIWRDFSGLSSYGSLQSYDVKPLSNTYDTTYGVGQIYSSSVPGNSSLYAISRGGRWSYTGNVGAFTLDSHYSESIRHYAYGFRCASNAISKTQTYMPTSGVSGSGGEKFAVGTSAGARIYQTINLGNTDNYDFTAYVYSGSNSISSDGLTSTIARLWYNGRTVNTSYSDASSTKGAGWWKLTTTLIGANEDREIGIYVYPNKDIIFDDVSISKQIAVSENLTNISISGSPTNYSFLADTYIYNNVTVPYSTSSIQVTPTGSGVITVNGKIVSSGQASESIALTPLIEQTINVINTDDGNSPIVYSINITRNGVLPTPTFSTVAGPIAFGTTVTITSAGAEAIYYTTDGSDPTTGSINQAVVPLVINSAVTIKAIAVKTDWGSSPIAVAAYVQAHATDLTSLVLSGSPLYFTFSGSTYSYDSVIQRGVNSITLTPTGAGTIKIENVQVNSGSASGAISLTTDVKKTVSVVISEPNKLDTTYTLNLVLSSKALGDSSDGGKIAYIDQTGLSGFVAATSDQISYIGGGAWGCSGTLLTGAKGTNVGTGYQNSLDILAECGDNETAVKLATGYSGGGFTDWYLPSLGELTIMYQNRALIGGLISQYYWSSTDYSATNAEGFYFSAGWSLNLSKSSTSFSIRAIRNFYSTSVPAFSTNSGPIAFGTTVNITLAGSSSIYYTVDGSTPTSSSTNQAVTPLVINSPVTVKAIAEMPGNTFSPIGVASYFQVRTPIPTFSSASGPITFGTTVTITSTGSSAIYYTIDGSTPTTSSTNQLITPLVINSAVTVKALAVKTGAINSIVASASYTQAVSADLSNIVLSGSALNYTYSASTYAYTNVVIPSSAASITVTPTGSGVITVEGTPVSSGIASGAIALTLGIQKTITIISTETGKSAKTYTIQAVSSTHSIGESYQGGKVAYIDGTGIHGFVAATADQSASAAWGCQGTAITTLAIVGSGSQNTQNILAGCATAGIAARVANSYAGGGYNDWYLPSQAELSILYTSKATLGGFVNSIYWTSTQDPSSAFIAFDKQFSDGSNIWDQKNTGRSVRAIRSY